MAERAIRSAWEAILPAQCETCPAETPAYLICQVVSQLLPLYRSDTQDTPDSAGGTLPDKERVIEALQLLEDAMFPGRMSVEAVSMGMLEPFLEERLSRAYRLLSAEIARSLPLRWKSAWAQTCRERGERVPKPLAAEEIRAEAERLTQVFFTRLPHIRQLLIKDVQSAYNGDPAALSFAEVALCYPGLAAITSHRLAHELYALDVPVVPRIMSEYTHAQTGVDIHPGAEIGESFFIDHATGVVIGETTEIGHNVKIYQGVTLGAKSFPLDENGYPIKRIKRHPTIEDKVIIYANATILGDVVIGEEAVIGANVFLTRSVAPRCTVVHRDVVEIRDEQGNVI